MKKLALILALSATLFGIGFTGLYTLGLDWPERFLRGLPPPLLGLVERVHDTVTAQLKPTMPHDCAHPPGSGLIASGASLSIKRAQKPESEIVIAAVGDVLLHSALQRQGFTHDLGFRSLWHGIEPLLSQADLTYANLEGPVAPHLARNMTRVEAAPDRFDGDVFSSYPRFNYPPALLAALKDSGVDVVSTANNHSLDRGWRGADSTIHHVTAHGLQYTGTRLSDHKQAGWHTVTRVGKHRIAWLACTYGTNGLPDRKNQVLHCFKNEKEVLDEITALKSRKEVQAVILTPHWGQQYRHTPTPRQVAFARAAIEAGAVAVLGSHPHVIQPWAVHRAQSGREGLIMYSLGNFVSGQRGLARRSTIALLLGLTEGADTSLVLAGARYVPLAMTYRGSARTGAITVRPTDHHRQAHALNRSHLTSLLASDHILPPDHALTTLGPCRSHHGGPGLS